MPRSKEAIIDSKSAARDRKLGRCVNRVPEMNLFDYLGRRIATA